MIKSIQYCISLIKITENNIQNKLKGKLRIIDYSNNDFVCLYYASFLLKDFVLEFSGQKFSN
jgi:hypothetical protein